ncbi:MAG TPA: protocatechuate 3,4-dioxygenase subunit alpha [Vicinamibacterales bacterium]|nr:protocatechuate 3,4-dioxygenase subunit alpha [Vicinamibacterales bacterium]
MPERPLVATGSQTVGPFFHFGLTTNAPLGSLVRQDTPGERIRLQVRVLDGDGAPVPDAMVELYQADASGAYPPPGGLLPDGFGGFGRLPTGEDGTCVFETIRPGRVPDPRGGLQAAHINVCLFMRGLLRHIYTRIYFAGDPALAEDAVLALVPEDRRPTLTAKRAEASGSWLFDIRLQGSHETVFLDL